MHHSIKKNLIAHFIFSLLLLAGLSSCNGIKLLQRANSYDVSFKQPPETDSTMIIVQKNLMAHQEYYNNLDRLLMKAKDKGYFLYAERLFISPKQDTINWKLRRMYGFLPNREGYAHRLKILLDRGYQLSNKKHKTIMIPASISAAEIVKAYEQKFGKIILTTEDTATAFPAKIKHPLPKSQVQQALEQVRLDEIKKVRNLTEQNKFVYVANERLIALSDDFLKQVYQLEAQEKLRKISTAKNKNFIQPLSADSLRRTDDEHLKVGGAIDNMDAYAVIKASMYENTEMFSVNNGNGDFLMFPNARTHIKLSAAYKAVTLGFSFIPTFAQSASNIEEKGTSNGLDFSISIVKDNWFHDFRLRYVEGFFLDNSLSDALMDNGPKFIKKPNYEYAALEGLTGYKFNKRFSLKALTNQTERQLKSAGSFMASVNYRYYATSDPSDSLKLADLSRSRNFELGASLGYYYTLVISKRIYLSAGFAPGIGVVQSWMHLDSGNGQTEFRREAAPLVRIDGRTTLGYNGERFFAGMYSQFSNGTFLNASPIVNTDFRTVVQLFVGYRFNPPRLLRMINFKL
ncbi:hypothetical protein PEPS_45340 (plasmid) [Persicobacter psychrovividus]|uniref:Uncharacterized protein n=2 Tax=Persicobacter psychrovividus TaxID=387638 RepID=A0ABN6LGL7_9BACT|nr:hypothetical protein PEPS_45340 [Persicobacter psychrovividus]